MDNTKQETAMGPWPYLLPMLSFLLLVEISNRVPQSWQLPMLFTRVIVPLGLLVFFRRRGAYRELQFRWTAVTIVDIALGIVLAGMWIGPYIWMPSLRPEADTSPFNPAMAGVTLVPLVLAVRMIGYALVTPLMEELFMRSFLIRYVEVFDDPESDFREIPIGKFGWISFIAVIVVFLATHVPWEWYVMLPWAVVTTLWLYYRKDLFAVIVVHAATNATILLAAILLGDTFNDGSGGKLPLWFFV